MKPKPTVGQTLFSLNIGNAARRGCEQVLTPVVVFSVGRKYFTACKPGNEQYAHLQTKYHLDSWDEVTHYSPNSHLYAAAQDWHDEKEATELHDRIRKAFNTWNRVKLPLASLRQIASFLPPPTQPEKP